MALNTNLERYYKLDGNLNEEVLSANGTLVGGSYVTGPAPFGQGLDTANLAANGAHLPALDLMGDISIMMWVKITTSNLYCFALGQVLGAGGADINYGIVQIGQTLEMYGTGNTPSEQTPSFTLGTSHLVIFKRTASSGLAQVSVDGAAFTSGITGPVPHSVPSAYLQLQHRDDLYSGFGGVLSNVGVWSRLLSNTEASQLWNGGAGLPYSSIAPPPPPPPPVTPALAAVLPQGAITDYGVDVATWPELSDTFLLVSQRRAVAEVIYRRLTTERGQLAFCPDIGCNVRSYLNDAMTPQRIAAINNDVVTEAKRDQRVLDAKADVVYLTSTGALAISLQVLTDFGPFTLTLNVTALTVSMLLDEN